MKKATIRRFLSLGLSFVILALSFAGGGNVQAEGARQDGPIVDPELLEKFDRSASAGYLIKFDSQTDLSPAYELDWIERGQFVYEALTRQDTALDTHQSFISIFLS